MKLQLLLLAAALPLAACAGDEAADTTADTTIVQTDPALTPDATTDPMAPADPMATDVTVDGTIAAAGQDITMLPAADAIANIDGWIAKLEGEQFAEIRTTLERLKTELSAQPIDNAALGATMSSLGEQTTASAANASSSSQEGLRTLGGALSAAGAKLSGSAM